MMHEARSMIHVQKTIMHRREAKSAEKKNG